MASLKADSNWTTWLSTHTEKKREMSREQGSRSGSCWLQGDTSSLRGRTGPDDDDLGHRADDNMPHQLRCFGVASSEEESILVAGRTLQGNHFGIGTPLRGKWATQRPSASTFHLASCTRVETPPMLESNNSEVQREFR
jgi:hypothetical protein